MKLIAGIFAFITIILTIIAFIPLLGWLNWLFIPFGLVSLLIAALSRSRGATTVCAIAIIVGVLRLMLGGGLF